MLQFVTVLTQHIAKLFQRLKSGFKGFFGTNINKILIQAKKLYFYCFINPSVQETNITYVLLFENKKRRKIYKRDSYMIADTKYYNVLTDRRGVFDDTLEMI